MKKYHNYGLDVIIICVGLLIVYLFFNISQEGQRYLTYKELMEIYGVNVTPADYRLMSTNKSSIEYKCLYNIETFDVWKGKLIFADSKCSLPSCYIIEQKGKGTSMLPTLNENMTLIFKVGDVFSDLSTGMIISYYNSNLKGYVAHRIVGITYKDGMKYYITKGDGNNYCDPAIPYTEVKDVLVGVRK